MTVSVGTKDECINVDSAQKCLPQRWRNEPPYVPAQKQNKDTVRAGPEPARPSLGQPGPTEDMAQPLAQSEGRVGPDICQGKAAVGPGQPGSV